MFLTVFAVNHNPYRNSEDIGTEFEWHALSNNIMKNSQYLLIVLASISLVV